MNALAHEMILRKTKEAARKLSFVASSAKDQALRFLKEALLSQQERLLQANKLDLQSLPPDTSSAFRDRLTLTPERVRLMAESLEQVAQLKDPVGTVESQKTLPNGLELNRVRAPLGVIFMIFESRPNVITEAFSLAFKAGNAMILRGGRESNHSAQILYELITSSLEKAHLDPHCLWGITDPDRQLVQTLLKQKRYIDVVVPRGGEGLIELVARESLIPIIKNDRGVCHVYLHEDAAADMAESIAVNAKCQRPGVCNSMETLLVHEKIASQWLPRIYQAMKAYSVLWHGCPRVLQILGSHDDVLPATESHYATEYLDYKMNCRVVGSLDEAIAHIDRYGSGHSEAIVTQNPNTAREFQNRIDAAAVYWNASTRFTDGFEFGLGGELGISTQKLHVRGPVGLHELTSTRWIINGQGQTRS